MPDCRDSPVVSSFELSEESSHLDPSATTSTPIVNSKSVIYSRPLFATPILQCGSCVDAAGCFQAGAGTNLAGPSTLAVP